MKKFAFVMMLFLLAIPRNAYTHSAWTEAFPDEDQVLTEPPERVIFTMIGNLNHELSRIEVFDQEENKVSKETECSESGGFTTMQVELLEGLKPGEYTVRWHFVNKDDHFQKGQDGNYKFTIE